MNVSISEKIVNYRVQSKNIEEIQEPIGAYIKRERVSQGLNQDYVCKGICSVSYYSRIENSETVPGDDYIVKFFKRLNKPVPKEYSSTSKNKEIIDNFISAIEYKNETLFQEMYDEIKKTEQKYELYELVYNIIKGNTEEAERLIKLLHDQQRYFNNDELLLYLEMLGSFYTINLELDKAEKYLFMALKLQSSMNIEKPIIYYKYAWILGKNNQNIKCIDYASKAEELFKATNNVYRTIQCQMLVAIKLSNNYYDKAIKLYENIIKSSLHHNYIDLYKINCLNLALLLKENKIYEKSKETFERLLNKFIDDKIFIIDIYIEYIDLLILNKNIDEAIVHLNKFKDLNNQSKKTQFFINYYTVKTSEFTEDDLIKYYKNDFIPYCVKVNNVILEKRIRKEFSLLLEKNNMLKESIEENKKIICLLEK